MMVFLSRYKRLNNFYFILACLIIVTSLYLFFKSHNSSKQYPAASNNFIKKIAIDPEEDVESSHNEQTYHDKCETDTKDLKCIINNEKTVPGCLDFKGNPYVPFALVADQFEISGEVIDDALYFNHSTNRIKNINLPYSHDGAFIFFDEYNVEMRDRVLFVSPDEGVPVSNQWDKHGYYYCIQISQFALSHYSKYILEKKQKTSTNSPVINLADINKWTIPDGSNLGRPPGKEIVNFSASNSPLLLPLKLSLVNDDSTSSDTSLSKILVVRGRWTYGTKLSVYCSWGLLPSVKLEYICKKSPYGRHMNRWVVNNKDHTVVTYYLNHCLDNEIVDVHLVRDLRVDLVKSFAGKKKFRTEVKSWQLRVIKSMTLSGLGQLSDFYLTRSAHIDQFLLAANWLVRHQDSKGGWSTPVARIFKKFRALDPGWYSAMAQGQAISVLVRAYSHTRDKRYLSAAANALPLFKTSSKEGGITTHFVNNQSMPWYEEYPTDPPLFVLNGFMYSLIGLYDLSRVSSSESSQTALQLYRSGLSTLHQLLPLFDSGIGSFYDLRHFTGAIKGFDGPNRARWEYHTVHIEQLQLLAHLNPDQPLWNTTIKRWTAYLSGYRSPHN